MGWEEPPSSGLCASLGGGKGVAGVFGVGGGSCSALGSSRMGFIGAALHPTSSSRQTGIALTRLLVRKPSEAWIWRQLLPALSPSPTGNGGFLQDNPLRGPQGTEKTCGGRRRVYNKRSFRGSQPAKRLSWRGRALAAGGVFMTA